MIKVSKLQIPARQHAKTFFSATRDSVFWTDVVLAENVVRGTIVGVGIDSGEPKCAEERQDGITADLGE